MTRKPLQLNQNGDRESIFVSRNVKSSGYGKRSETTKHGWNKIPYETNFEAPNIFSNLRKSRRTVNKIPIQTI